MSGKYGALHDLVAKAELHDDSGSGMLRLNHGGKFMQAGGDLSVGNDNNIPTQIAMSCVALTRFLPDHLYVWPSFLATSTWIGTSLCKI
jgi:hypothetical protein